MAVNKRLFIPQEESGIDPTDYFNTVLYTGNGSNKNVSGVGFKPDIVWIKKRSSTGHHTLVDSVRGANSRIFPNLTNASSTNSGFSFNTDGFTTNSASSQSENNETFVAWCFHAGGDSNTYNIDGTGYSTVSAAGISLTDEVGSGSPVMDGCSINTQAGFGVYKIDPNNASSTDRARFTHKLTSAPELIITKSTDVALTWWTFTDAFDDSWDYLKLNDNDAKINDTLTGAAAADDTYIRMEQAFTSSCDDLMIYAFHSVDGVQKIGTYDGIDGTDVTVTTGFRPRFVLIKKVNSTGSWFIYDDERQDFDDFQARIVLPNTNGQENNWDSFYGLKATSTGFILEGYTNGNDSTNNTGDSYIYLAIA